MKYGDNYFEWIFFSAFFIRYVIQSAEENQSYERIFTGGKSQKVAIARAFYENSSLIILDEPSSALDPIAEYHLNKAMQKVAKKSR